IWLKLFILLLYFIVLFILARIFEVVIWYETGIYNKLKTILECRGLGYSGLAEKMNVSNLVQKSCKWWREYLLFLPSAKETAETMLNHVFRVHGFPRNILSDRGPQFIAQFWKAFCKLIGATVSLTSGYHPETNGQSERVNQDLEIGLRCLVSRDPSSWSKQLLWVEYAHKTLISSSIGSFPFQCVFGYQPPSFQIQSRR
uniref:Integrase catalytic domain-containing protein n=1 Tax=Mola mola TaxID=94237 RepID=A0A3Q3VMJ6_MOLML